MASDDNPSHGTGKNDSAGTAEQDKMTLVKVRSIGNFLPIANH